ncbi:RloB family protein [Nocardiopsis sp. CNT-189]|uniref:RloB family protein n=1 Tax=Nocardiopsis oceanisediminis TaxID=2816862 RepID=UPI003B3A9F1B
MTEVDYLNGLKRHFAALPVDIVPIGEGHDPLRVVERAVEERDEAAKNAKRQRDANLRFEEVWCLVDVDEHTRLHQAVALAKREGVDAVVSNPCFELWLLYHFQDYTSSIHRSVLGREKLCKHIDRYAKRLPKDFPFGAHEEAKRRALRVSDAPKAPCTVGPNPSTSAWLLIDAVRRGAKAGPA